MTRTRAHQVSIRLTEPEYSLLQTRAMTAQLPVTRYIIDTALSGKIRFYAPDEKLLRDLLLTLKRTGNLMNQIARRLNSADTTEVSGGAAQFAFDELSKLVEPQLACLDAAQKALAKTCRKKEGEQCHL
jgi:hypothetical protein